MEKKILEQWFTRAVDVYPAEAAGFLAAESDPFRNPVGHTLKENLAALLRELLGGMDAARLQSALENLIRIRAVQDLTASQAVGFIFLLRPILRQHAAELDITVLDNKIDQIALMAFDEYMRRREQVAELRVTEGLRAVRMPSHVARERSPR